MFVLIIFSLILIWMQASSLRFVIAASNNKSVIRDAEKLENTISSGDRNFSFKSGPILFSLGLIIALNFVQLGYFVVCAYIFNDFLITLGSAVFAGYTIYSLIKFIPRIKGFFKKPVSYLKEKTQGFEKGMSLVMTSLQIVFCAYIVVKILSKYKIFG